MTNPSSARPRAPPPRQTIAATRPEGGWRHDGNRQDRSAVGVGTERQRSSCSGRRPGPGAARARAQTAAAATTRTYYIAADEVDWDYAPAGRNVIAGRPFNDDENVFVAAGARTASGRPTRRRSSASTPTRRSPGSSRRTRAGSTPACSGRRSAPRSATRSRSCSATTRAGRTASIRTACATPRARRARRTTTAPRAPTRPTTPSDPGRTVTYTWEVPPRAGPAAHDGQSVMWMYHSHTDEIKDTNTGLMGPMIIYPDGALRADGSVVGIDREFVAVFSVMNENESHYLRRQHRAVRRRARHGRPGGPGLPGEQPHALHQRLRLRQRPDDGGQRR